MHTTNQENNKITAEQVEELIQILLQDKELRKIVVDVVKNPKIYNNLKITSEQALLYAEQGIERLQSNSISKNEKSQIVSKSVDFANNQAVQEDIQKGFSQGLIDKFKNLSTTKKLLVGGGVLSAAATAPLLPVIALTALVVAVLGLGGMAIGKGTVVAGKTIKHGAEVTGKAVAHGAQIAGKAVAHGIEVAKEKISDAAEVISDKSKHAANKAKESIIEVSKGGKHVLKNAVDKVPGRHTNIKRFMEHTNEFIETQTLETVKFMKEFILQDGKTHVDVNLSFNKGNAQYSIDSTIEKDTTYKIDSDKVQALRNIIDKEGKKVSLTSKDLDALLEKGKSTFKDQDDGKFKDALAKFAPIMDDQAIQDKLADELKEIKKAKTKEEPKSFFKKVKDVSLHRNNESQRQVG